MPNLNPKMLCMVAMAVVCLFLLYSKKRSAGKVKINDNLKKPPNQILPSPLPPPPQKDLFIDDIDELINNIYFIQLHTK
jgi:hypothetical protein